MARQRQPAPPLTSRPSDSSPATLDSLPDLRGLVAPLPLEGSQTTAMLGIEGNTAAAVTEHDTHHHHQPTERTALLAGTRGGSSSKGGEDPDDDNNDEDDQNNDDAEQIEALKQLPWYRRPHAFYIHASILFMALGMGLLGAAKIEQFTQAICHQLNEDTAAHSPFDPTLLLQTPEQCRHSTSVQKRVAELNATIMVIMGICCVCTTPFWGALSDRIGRKPCIALNTLSFVLGDAVLLVVLSRKDTVPYRWLLLYPLVEGLFGGMGGGQSIMSAYIGDCTGAGTRAGTFSVMMGVAFAGIAIGPAIGSICIQLTGNVLAPFYIAFVAHSLQIVFTVLIMPESLPKTKQREAKRVYKVKKEEKALKTNQDLYYARLQGSSFPKRVYIACKAIARPVGNIFAPLALLAPTDNGKGGRDWSLPILALATGFYTMMMSIYSIKMQYAQLKFGWSSVQLGNFLSLMGITRIVALVVIIPLFIRLIRKPHTEPLREPPSDERTVSEEVRHQRRTNANASGFAAHEDDEWDAHKAQHRQQHDYQFDLRLARYSIVVDMAAYTALLFTHNATQFVICVMVQALGSGANPALSSLCLMFANPEETGSLMAAMSVLQTFLGQIAAPTLFNSLYAATVDFWPEAFFLCGVCIYALALVGLLLVRIRRPRWNGYSTEHPDGEHAVSDIITETTHQ